MSRLPLDLYAEVETASGARFRWDANQAPGSRLRNFSFRTKIGEGFSDANGQLARRIDQDYPDLSLVNSVTVVGADGSVAYEGRLAAMPRDLSDMHSIGVTLAGWMAHAKDRKFTQIYVDRSLSSWTEPSLARRVRLASTLTAPQGKIPVTITGSGVSWAPPNEALPSGEVAEAHYDAGPGLQIGRIEYKGRRDGAFTSFEAPTVFVDASTSNMSAATSEALTLDDTHRVATAFTDGRYVMLRARTTGATTPAAGHLQSFDRLIMIGVHDASIINAGGDSVGVSAGAVIRDIANTYCPLLDTSGVQNTDYAIQQLAFRERTFPYDAFLEINKYHLWHLGVWENRRLDFHPYDLADYQWEIRTDDPGTTFSPQGPSTEDLFNGIAVTYVDLLTGTRNTLTPDDDATLSDMSNTNPWNQHGIAHWDEITLSTPSTEDAALQLGAAALADRNRAKTPGTITCKDYIRDRAGNEQPVWKVRAGETISVTNFPNDSPRLVVETDYNDEDKTIRIAVDRPFQLLEAYLDRQQNALQAGGLV